MATLGLIVVSLLAIVLTLRLAAGGGPDDRARVLDALVAALISSGTVGVWGIVLRPLFTSDTRVPPDIVRGDVITGRFVDVAAYFTLTLIPNLVGLLILAHLPATGRRGVPGWRSLRRGWFLPLGVLYGEVIMVATATGWAVFFNLLGRDLSLLQSSGRFLAALLGEPLLHAMAVLGGITALGILTALRARRGITV